MKEPSAFLKNCPICNSEHIQRVEDVVERKIRQKTIRIPKVAHWVCGNCGEKFFFPDSIRKMRAYMEQNATPIKREKQSIA